MRDNNSILVAINSGYVHSSLAVRMLSRECGVPFCEFNINMYKKDVLPRLADYKVLFFSCYIWNISYIYDLIGDLKKINGDCLIVLGGPSVSFGAKSIMEENADIDYIMTGEGEDTIAPLFDCIIRGNLPQMSGVVYRDNNQVMGDDTYVLSRNLKCLPYQGDIVYFETTRGCPFSCTYCLSGYLKGVRYYDLDDVKKSLTALSGMRVRVVKFTDRTFNANKQWAKEILNHLLTLKGKTMWHFEIGGDLLDEEIISLLNSGNFQVEIGIQSFNEDTLAAVKRSCDLDRLCENIGKLTIHKHIDLIAGLPEEDLTSFKSSFDRAYSLKADMLQLGFLKVLPGSALRDDDRLVFSDSPPYTVLKTKWLTAHDIFQLQRVEKALDVYYGSGRFKHSLKFLEDKVLHPYDIFQGLSQSFGDDIYSPIGFSRAIDNMYRAYGGDYGELCELLRCDYYLSGAKGAVPSCFKPISYVKKDVRKKLGLTKDEDFFLADINYKTYKRTLCAVLKDSGEVMEIGDSI